MKVSLTDKEKEILTLICDGYSNQEIADKLFMHIRTVQGKRQELYYKLGVSRIANVVTWAIENGYYKVNIKNHIVNY